MNSLTLLFTEIIYLASQKLAMPMVNILDQSIPAYLLYILQNIALNTKSKYGLHLLRICAAVTGY